MDNKNNCRPKCNHKFHFARLIPDWYELGTEKAIFVCENCGMLKELKIWKE